MNAETRIQLGPFELISPLGRGGMGEVWRGVHAAQQTPVAVKMVAAELAQEPRFRAAFRSEIRAAAALRHPGIAMVFDCGEVNDLAEELSGGRFSAGGLYLAMELVDGGTLAEIAIPMRWGDLAAVLLSLLDALAYAHARGVIHRDLKPSNVLLAPGDAATIVKLTDFGIAHALENQTKTGGSHETESSLEPIMGTPQYMAPEQLRGRWRDYGPWTDLYAVGCLAYELASGRPPFDCKDFYATAMAHLKNPIPDPAVPSGYPSGFGVWLGRLLAKEPLGRFRRAADAAWALSMIAGDEVRLAAVTGSVGMADASDAVDELGSSFVDTTATLSTVVPVTETIMTTLPTVAATTLAQNALDGAGSFDGLHVSDEPGPAPRVPHMPESWCHQELFGRSLDLLGAGLGLYELRPIPLVDRDLERGAIWRALSDVFESRRTRLLLLRGPAGVGKSRLAQWACERAHETGAGTPLKAVHGPVMGPLDGLADMVARHLRCVGLTRTDALNRVEGILRQQCIDEEYEWQALTELISPAAETGGGGSSTFRFETPRERYDALERLLGRMAEERPVVLWLDDVQWGEDALGFAAHLIEAKETIPVLIVLTASDETLAERAGAQDRIERLLALSGVKELVLGPLKPEGHSLLVRNLLALEDSLAAQVEERTDGNPLFAVQLVGDWVRRGLLEVGQSGFSLRLGERAELPDDLYQVWSARVARLLGGVDTVAPSSAADLTTPGPGRLALELAATFGGEVDEAEWYAACVEAEVLAPSKLVEMLLSTRLATSSEDGRFSFVHGMLRESIERQAREEDRWVRHNRSCAAMLEKRHAQGGRGLAERLAHHLIEAGELRSALKPLLEAAEEYLDGASFPRSKALIAKREQLLEQLSVDHGDELWAWGWWLRARAECDAGYHDEALRWVDAVKVGAPEREWPKLLAKTLQVEGRVARRKGHFEGAIRCHQRAAAISREVGDEKDEVICLLNMCSIACVRADVTNANAILERIDILAERTDDQTVKIRQCMIRADLATLRRDWTTARAQVRQGVTLARQNGRRFNELASLAAMAEVDRHTGALDAAEVGFRRALHLARRWGLNYPMGIFLLADVFLARSDYDEARRYLETTHKRMKNRSPQGVQGMICTQLLCCAAQAGDWQAWDRYWAEAKHLLDRTGVIDLNLVTAARLAGDLASKAQQPERARQAYHLALAQAEVLRYDDHVQEIRDCLGALPECM